MTHKNKKAIISVTNDLYTDQRVHKVCLSLQSIGFEVLLVGRKRHLSKDLSKRSYATKRMRLFFEKGALFYAEYNIRLFLFLLFRKLDVLVSNDLDTLLANFTIHKLKRNSKLVYDSHEYYTEVPELIHRPKIQRIWERIEELIFPKLDTIFTVNESIAKMYETKYNKKLTVIRNISPSWKPEKLKTRSELDLPEDKFIVIIQGAGINIDRGAEEAVEAIQNIEGALLLIVGDGDVVPQLKDKVATNNWGQKVLFVGKKPYNEMMHYTFVSDLGLTLDKSTNLNYKFSLPNKVFDYIHGETPILATDLIEIRNIVDKYQVGEILKELSVETLTKTIQNIMNQPEKLKEWQENCKIAKLELNWEKESTKLIEMYGKL